MNRILLTISFTSLALFTFNCGGGSTTMPDPKRVGCQTTCEKPAQMAVDKCKKEKKAEDVCKLAGTTAESKCVDECVAK